MNSIAFKLTAFLGLVLANVALSMPTNEDPSDYWNALQDEYNAERYQQALVDQLKANRMREVKRNYHQAELLDYIRSLEMELAAMNNPQAVDDSSAPVIDNASAAVPAATSGVHRPSDVHSVDKRRRRRYGFWVTAINKMA